MLVDNNKFKNAIGANKFKSSMYTLEIKGASNAVVAPEDNEEEVTVVFEDGVAIFISDVTNKKASPSPSINTEAKIKISGHGWGHGVGLSQWGANNMAKAGLKYDEILKFYYDGAEISNGN